MTNRGIFDYSSREISNLRLCAFFSFFSRPKIEISSYSYRHSHGLQTIQKVAIYIFIERWINYRVKVTSGATPLTCFFFSNGIILCTGIVRTPQNKCFEWKERLQEFINYDYCDFLFNEPINFDVENWLKFTTWWGLYWPQEP